MASPIRRDKPHLQNDSAKDSSNSMEVNVHHSTNTDTKSNKNRHHNSGVYLRTGLFECLSFVTTCYITTIKLLNT